MKFPVTPVSRSGDLWLVGPHRLLCGDATRPEDVARALGGSLADMAFTDPPYNVDARAAKHAAIANDDLGSGFGAFLLAACSAFIPVTKGGISICMSSSELGKLKAAFEAQAVTGPPSSFGPRTPSRSGGLTTSGSTSQSSMAGPRGSAASGAGPAIRANVWRHDRPTKNDLHPTMKPIALVEQAIRNSSKTRDVVLDPFGGSGTTLMAAEARGRKACLVELEPGYCDVIVRRWQEATRGIATLDGSGQTFAEAAAERGVTLQQEAAE